MSRSFIKKRSNKKTISILQSTFTFLTLITIMFSFIFELSLLKVVCILLIELIVTLFILFYPYIIYPDRRYRWRLNQLFEIVFQKETLSGNALFPIVNYHFDRDRDIILFRFTWLGKVSLSTQNELEHRLSEIMFPSNDYILEEPETQTAYTDYTFIKKPKRLIIDYEEDSYTEDVILDRIQLNEAFYWRLSHQAAHMAITGLTGSGKTMMIYYLNLEAANLTNELYIMDGKGGDLTNLTSVTISETTEEIVHVFDHLIATMHDRMALIKAENIGNVTASEIGLPHIFVFIDELAAIMLNAKKTDRINKQQNKLNNRTKGWQPLKETYALEITSALTELILVSRQASIHLVLSAQHFSAQLLEDSTVRSNISLKILLGRQTPQEYNMLNLTQDQLPAVDHSVIGSGVIMMDGYGWVNARPFETPLLEFHQLPPNDVLAERLALHDD